MSNLPNSAIRLIPPSFRGNYCPESWAAFARDIVAGTSAQLALRKGLTFYNFGGTSTYPPAPTPEPPGLTCPASWVFDFAANKTITPSIGPTPTFERSTIGTYFDSSGIIQTAGINIPRFDYRYENGVWVSKGLLIEPDTNTQYGPSEDFSNAVWTKTGTTATANITTAPDGTTTGNQVFETSANSIHAIGQAYFDPAPGQGLSCFFKQGTARYCYLHFQSAGAQYSVCVADLQTGTITLLQNNFSAANSCTAFIQDVSNGWYRLCVQNYAASNYGGASIGICNSGTPTLDTYLVPVAYVGNPANYIYAWGFQFERSDYVTSYIKNPNATTYSGGQVSNKISRGYDICYLNGGGFSSLWNLAEGSIFAEYNYSRVADLLFGLDSTGPASVTVFPNSVNNYLRIRSVSSAANQFAYDQFITANGGSTQANLQIVPGSGPFADIKCAAGFKENDFGFSVNGSDALTDISGSLTSVVDCFYIGNNNSSGGGSPILISKIRYYPCRLTNEELKTLTA